MILSHDRLRELTWGGGKLTDAEWASGYHFCLDWDGLCIGPEHDEWSACICDIPFKHIENKA